MKMKKKIKHTSPCGRFSEEIIVNESLVSFLKRKIFHKKKPD